MICTFLILACTVTLAVLVLVYPRDLPRERRNYMPVPEAQFGQGKRAGSRTGSVISRSQSVASCGPDDMQQLVKKKKLPILTAKVTQHV